MIRILIADDHGVLRDGLRALLASVPDMEVVGEASTGPDTLRLAEELNPDLVLLDVAMPDPDGLAVTRALQDSAPEVRVLILTASEEKAVLTEAIRAGACGYIVKRAIESELIEAVYSVMRGDMYVHPTVTRALLEGTILKSGPDESAGTDVLTPRETDVLLLLCDGLTNVQIAERLTVSPRTVESHRATLLAKLHVHSRAELVQYALSQGLLGDRPL